MAEMSQVSSETSSQANSTDARPVYEVGFHVVPTAEESEVQRIVGDIRAQILKGGAEILSEGAPVRTRLAYAIEQTSAGKREAFEEAHFGFIKFVTEREFIPALQTYLRADKNLIRYLLAETTREDVMAAPRRATFASDRLEGETIKKPQAEPEKKGKVSEEDLDKSIDALVS